MIAVFAVALLSLAAVHVCTDADDEEQPLMLLGDANPSGTCGTDLTWSLNTTTGELTISGTGTTMTNFTSSNKAGWDAYGSSIKKITIAAPNLTKLGDRAFYSYSNEYDSLESIDFGSVTTLGLFSFYQCGIANLYIPDTVTGATGANMFKPEKLESIYISSAFATQNYLGFVVMSKERPVAFYDSDGQTLMYKYTSGAASPTAEVLNLRGNVFYKAENITVEGDGGTGYAFVKGTDIASNAYAGQVRYYLDGSVLKINAFRSDNAEMKPYNSSISLAPWGTDITGVEIGHGVINVSAYSFTGCTKLTSVKLSDTVGSIGISAFFACTSLKSIDLMNVTQIRTRAFMGCSSLEDLIISDSAISIGSTAFSNCTSLKDLVIPDSVTTIESKAFSGCTGLKTIRLGTGLTSLASDAFQDFEFVASDTVTALEKSATSLKGKAFYLKENTGKMQECKTTGDVFWALEGTELHIFGNGAIGNYPSNVYPEWGSGVTKVIIAEGVTKIGEYAFITQRDLKEVELPETLTKISSGAFSGCTALKSVTIPESLQWLEGDAFVNCTAIEYLEIKSTTMNVSGLPFNNVFSFCDVDGSTALSRTAADTFRGSIFIKSSTGTYIKQGTTGEVHYGIDGTTLTIWGNGEMNDYLSFGSRPWSAKAADFTDIVIKDGVTHIGSYAFDRFRLLTSVAIPDSVGSIGEYAFSNCSSLLAFTVGESNTSFTAADGVLFNKDKTELIKYPNGKEGAYTVPSTVKTIGARAFSSSNVTSLDLSSVTKIGDRAFYNTTSITAVKFGKNLEEIGEEIFMSQTLRDMKGNYMTVTAEKLAGKTFIGGYNNPNTILYYVGTGLSSGVVTVEVSGTSGTISEFRISSIKNYSSELGLQIVFEGYTVTLDSKALGAVSDSLEMTVAETDPTTLSDAARTAVNGRTVYTINAGSLTDLGGGHAVVMLPYEPKSEDETSRIYVVCVKSDGTVEKMELTDVCSDYVEFSTTHFSDFAVMMQYVVSIKGEGVTVKSGDTVLSDGAKVDCGTVITATIANKDGNEGHLAVSAPMNSDGSYTVLSDIEVSGTYAISKYKVTLAGEGLNVRNGSISLSNGDEVDWGTVLTVSIADKEGHTGSVTASVGTIDNGSYIVSSDVTFTGAYAINSYTVTIVGNGVTVMNGSVELASGDKVDWGTVLTVSITQTSSGKQGHLAASAGAIVDGKYTVLSDVTITGTFKITTHKVTLAGEGLTVMNGTEPVSNGDEVDWGTVLTISIADKDRKVGSISVDVGAVENGMYTVTSDVTITGSYEARQYTVTILGEGITVMNGGTEGKSGDKVDVGTVLKVTMEGKSGHRSNIESSVGTLENGNHTVESDVTFTGSYTKEKDDDNTALIAGVAIVVVVLAILGLVLFVKPGILKKH